MRCLLLALSCTCALYAQTLRIDGGAAPMENIFKPIRQSCAQQLGLTLDLRENGPELSLLALQRGEVEAAAAGLSPAAWFELMAQKGHKGIDPARFQSQKIGFDRINVFLHEDLLLLELSKSQLKALFTGTITNWKAMGGPDLPVVVILGDKVPGTNKVFQDQILDREAYTPTAKIVGTTPEIMEKIATTPGAIGIGPISAMKHRKTNSPVTPEVGRPITLMTLGAASPDLEKLLTFLRTKGQALISK